jgi:hypothetical protein
MPCIIKAAVRPIATTPPMIEGLTRTLNMVFGASFLGVMSYNAIA